MKKNLFFLFFSVFSYAQYVSPYYPLKQDAEYRAEKPGQLTYYSSDFVQGLLQNFMKYRLGMSMIDSKSDDKNKAYTQIYQDMFSTGKLYVTLKWEIIRPKSASEDDIIPEVVKSIKITGTPSRVISFFVYYWDTTIDFESVKSDIERKHMQDVAHFYFNKGKPYILVKNGTFDTIKEFEEYFNTLLEKEKQTQNPNLQN